MLVPALLALRQSGGPDLVDTGSTGAKLLSLQLRLHIRKGAEGESRAQGVDEANARRADRDRAWFDIRLLAAFDLSDGLDSIEGAMDVAGLLV